MSSEALAPGDGEPVRSAAELIEEMPALDEPRLLDALLRFEHAHRRRWVNDMRACFCDDALIESVASGGLALGADETVEVLERVFDDGVYSIRDWRYEELAPQTVLSWTSARRLIGEARMRDEVVCRLHTGRGGLMWRVKLFRTREAAIEHLELHGPSLGLGDA